MSTSNLKNLHLKAFSTKTLQVYRVGGWERGGATPGRESSHLIPNRARGLSPLLSLGQRRGCAPCPSPGFSAQRSKHRASPWKRASPSAAEDSFSTL